MGNIRSSTKLQALEKAILNKQEPESEGGVKTKLVTQSDLFDSAPHGRRIGRRSSGSDNLSSLLTTFECTSENRTMLEVISLAKEQGFSAGGLAALSEGPWTTWACWQLHPCLESIGMTNQGEAVCYKRNEDDGSWLLWGLQSEVGIQCSRHESVTQSDETTGFFNISRVSFPFQYNYSAPYVAKELRHVPGSGIDSRTHVFSTTINAAQGSQGACRGPNGKIFFAGSNIGVLDVYSETYRIINVGGERNAYNQCHLVSERKIVFVPNGGSNFLILDPENETFKTVSSGGLGATIANQVGSDGKIYFILRTGGSMGIFDSDTEKFTFKPFDSSLGLCNSGDYRGAVLGPNGKVYFVRAYPTVLCAALLVMHGFSSDHIFSLFLLVAAGPLEIMQQNCSIRDIHWQVYIRHHGVTSLFYGFSVCWRSARP